MGTKAVERLKEIAEKAADIQAKLDEGSDEERSEKATELKSLMDEGVALRDSIVRGKTIDSFTDTLSEDVKPEAQQAKDVLLGVNGSFGVFAERKGFEDAVEKWKAKQVDTRWGFDIRYKADIDNAVAEVNAGVVPTGSRGPQYGGVVQPYYYPGIIEPPTRTPLIADLFAQGSTDSNLVRLVKETVTTDGASVSAEGAAYGASKIEVEPVDWPVRDITTLLPVTEDILTDIPAMSAYLSMRLSKFVQLAEENELVNGDGTGSHLSGLLAADDTTPRPQGSDDLDSAVMKLCADVYSASFMDPQWVVMSPSTWASYITQRTDLNGGHGQFLAGPVSLTAIRQIWGLPITVTPVLPDDVILVGNSAAGMIFRNGGLRVESSTGYGTFFGEGLVAIRGKVRTAFTLFRPQAIGILNLGS